MNSCQRLLSLAADCELFHTLDGVAYATVHVVDHHENWPVDGDRFRLWLCHGYHRQTTSMPGARALQEAIRCLEAKAIFDGAARPVFLRLAEEGGRTFLDLANDKWQAVEIDEQGWRVVACPRVKFWRPRGMQSLPMPQPGGSIRELRPFTNTSNDLDWTLQIGWLLGALRPHGPYPVLVLHGEHGTAKTTVARMLRALVDPNIAGVRAEPRDVQDLMIAANNAWVLSFDNLSRISASLSDALCRLATGGGFAVRELYSDAEETIFDSKRPVILTGIGELVVRGDLLDRSIRLEPPPIRSSERRPEAELWREFDDACPRILGALLTVVASALKALPTTNLTDYPRMADFTAWVSAAEPGLGWTPRTFVAAYEENRASAHELALEASPIMPPLLMLLRRGPWEGEAASLLCALAAEAGETVTKGRGWPRDAHALSVNLRRLAPNLRAIGMDVTFWRETDHRRRRKIRISASEASEASEPGTFATPARASGPDEARPWQDIDEKANEFDAELKDIAQEAKENGEFNAATAAMRERVKILQLKEKMRSRLPELSQVKAAKPQHLESMGDEQLDEHIRELLARDELPRPVEPSSGAPRETTPTVKK